MILQLNEELEQFDEQVKPSSLRRKFSGHWQTLVGRPVPLLELATSKHRASHPPLFSHGLKSGAG